MIKLINRISWLLLLLAAGTTLIMVGLLVLTSGNVDVLGLGTSGAAVATPSIQARTTNITGPATLNSVLPKRPLFASVPLPQEISQRPSVIVTNLLLSVILALAFGTVSTVLNNMIREQEGTFRDWLKSIHMDWLVSLISSGSKQAVHRGCLGLPIILLIFALYGIIFATLEQGTSILSPDGIQLAIVMAMSVGLVSLGGDVARRWLSTLWRSRTRYGIYPANLLLAMGTTVLSRTLHLSPGIVFGVPGGADVELDAERRQLREVVLAFTTLATVLVLGGLGWAGTGLIAQIGIEPLSAEVLTFWGPIVRLVQTIGLAIFAVAAQTAFFEMLPLSATLGSKIFSWSGIVWTITFIPIVFCFAHTMLNPNGDFLAAFQSANVRVTIMLTGILVIVTLFLWLYVRFIVPRFQPVSAIPSPEIVHSDTKPMQPYRYEPPVKQISEIERTVQAPPVETRETPRPSSLLTVKIKLPSFVPSEDEEEAKSDTRPGAPVQISEPATTDEDTKPGDPADETASDRSYYPDPAYHYDNLFPPPRPGDEDYLESGFDEDTPPSESGETPTETQPPKPPDSLPL